MINFKDIKKRKQFDKTSLLYDKLQKTFAKLTSRTIAKCVFTFSSMKEKTEGFFSSELLTGIFSYVSRTTCKNAIFVLLQS